MRTETRSHTHDGRDLGAGVFEVVELCQPAQGGDAEGHRVQGAGTPTGRNLPTGRNRL